MSELGEIGEYVKVDGLFILFDNLYLIWANAPVLSIYDQKSLSEKAFIHSDAKFQKSSRILP